VRVEVAVLPRTMTGGGVWVSVAVREGVPLDVAVSEGVGVRVFVGVGESV